MTHMCAHYKTLAVTLMIKVYLGGGGGGGGGSTDRPMCAVITL